MTVWHNPKGSTGLRNSLNDSRVSQKRICADCNIEKTWKFKTKKGMRRQYVDDIGKLWSSGGSGNCCPECSLLRSKRSQSKAKRKKLLMELE